ncbi:tRNA (guanosine(46)-N(7))-methyltransferase TrmB [Nocardioides sp. R-C-SC26]|uniref:tRNA (guanine(46)-N(7))-methyltransferase TrmB n=1 Tax=Nocardioides sp. R-C-SC26 TaxID=2870414 RepID=UPI001E44ADE8|nr:tRNA (guanine(46)-N(7))-methyltransferase TrmB [Nocardioides sp. R-C-SC26]
MDPSLESAVAPARPHHTFTPDGRRIREVLTYSRRGSRFTSSQAEAWDAFADRWFIPDEAVDSPEFSWSAWFDREAPIAVEIGSGIGEATAALAAGRPDLNIVAFEVWRPGVADTLARLGQGGLTNVRMCSVDAVWSLEHLFLPDSLAELWTFFPDPWHKTRHHKRRLVAQPFAGLAASRLAHGATWRLATDWAEYADQMSEVLDAEPLLAGGRTPRWAERPVTKFERKGIRAGREIVDLAYARV